MTQCIIANQVMDNQEQLDPLLVREFLMERFKVPDDTEMSECCYHYTTADVLEKFLIKDGDLRCTHCRALNDRNEYFVGVDALDEYMQNRNWNQNLSKQIINQLKGFAQFDLGMPWIFSFSIYNDSLFQWTTYTDKKEGGYAIGFSISSLQQLVEKRNAKGNVDATCPVTTYLLPCLYVGIDDIFGRLDDFFKQYIASGAVYASELDDQSVKKIFLLASVAPLFIKEKSFFIEGEWRLVLEPNFNEAYDCVESIGGRPRMWARVNDDIGLLRDVIKSVIVSPHGKRESLYVNALNLKRRYKANFKITFSHSSYQG